MSLILPKVGAVGLWQAPLLIAVIGAICIALVPTAKRFHDFLLSTSRRSALAWGVDNAEKGYLAKQNHLSEDDLFQLEKRAFFSKVNFLPRGSRFLRLESDRSMLTKTDVAFRMPWQSL